MNHTELIAFYEKRRQNFTIQLNAKESAINKISTFRLLSALAIAISIYFTFQHTNVVYLLVAFLLLFIWLVRKHTILFNEKIVLQNLVAINLAECKALKGDYSYQPAGFEFVDPRHPYTHDLDIFGEGSVFQYINRGSTFGGKQLLASSLQHPLQSKSRITQRQEAIKELTDKIEFRQLLQAEATDVKDSKGDREQLLNWLQQPNMLFGKEFFRFLLVILPIVTVGLVGISFFTSGVKPFAILAALIQWVFVGVYFKRVNAFHDYVSRKKNVLEQYSKILGVFNKEKFNSIQLANLSQITHQAEEKIAELATLVGRLDARLNFMTNLVVNTTVMYDLQCVYRLEKWKAKNSAHLEKWLDAISQTEMLSGFAAFAFNNTSFCYACIHSSLSIKSNGLAHPLINEEERIPNDLLQGEPQRVLVITGANMAGKSTFLRTLGVNVVLALNGAPVCAKEFSCPVMELRSGMRTADSLKDHQSYFYAELNRLKAITDELKQDKPLLILLDEILKGTNSTDKQAGSIALVKQLIQHSCLAIIATHDLVLGELERIYPQQIRNYHFEPTIENDQLSFDYKLKPGIAEKMNATFLMKKMGIIPS